MLGTSYSGADLVSHFTHLSSLWVRHPSTTAFIHNFSQLHFKLITTLLALIPLSKKSSDTGTPTMVITATDFYGSQDPCILNFISCFVGPHIELIDGRFITETGLSASMLYFVNSNTGRWSDTFLPMMSVLPRTILLINFPHNSPSTILWFLNIATSYHTPTSSVMAGTISRIGNATIWISTCVPCELHKPLTKRIFAVHYNLTVP